MWDEGEQEGKEEKVQVIILTTLLINPARPPKPKRMETIHNSHIKDVISWSYFQNSNFLFFVCFLFLYIFLRFTSFVFSIVDSFNSTAGPRSRHQSITIACEVFASSSNTLLIDESYMPLSDQQWRCSSTVAMKSRRHSGSKNVVYWLLMEEGRNTEGRDHARLSMQSERIFDFYI